MSAAPVEEPPFDPFDVEIEQAVIGAMLVRPNLIDVAAASLDTGEFYDPVHARLFEMIIQLKSEEDGPVSPVLLHSVMKRDPGLKELGGIAYLANLAGAGCTPGSLPPYIRQLKDLAMRRAVIQVGSDILADAKLPPHEIGSRAIADAATERLLQVGAAAAAPPVSAYDTAMESLLEAQDTMAGKPVPVVKTGFQKLDGEIGGLRGGDFIVIGGKSGSGKSALMGSLALNTSRAGIPTIVFSLEMTRRQWVERTVCDLDFSRIDGERPLWYSKVRNGKMSNAEFDRFGAAMRDLPDKNLLEIHDASSLTMGQISSRLRAFAAKHRNPDGTPKIGVAIVDYLQKVEPEDQRENRERQVARIAMGLKNLAKLVGWPIVAGSQLNEDDKNREHKRPRLGDLRESKVIGNEADLFICPWREAYFVEQERPMGAHAGDSAWLTWKEKLKPVLNKFELLCIKNRHGRTFDLDMFCEIGASAIRDWKPGSAEAVAGQAQLELADQF